MQKAAESAAFCILQQNSTDQYRACGRRRQSVIPVLTFHFKGGKDYLEGCYQHEEEEQKNGCCSKETLHCRNGLMQICFFPERLQDADADSRQAAEKQQNIQHIARVSVLLLEYAERTVKGWQLVEVH